MREKTLGAGLAISPSAAGYLYLLKEFDTRYTKSLQTVRKHRPTAGTILLTLLVQTQVGAVDPLIERYPHLEKDGIDDIPGAVWNFLHDHWGKMAHGYTEWTPSETWEPDPEPDLTFEFEDGLPTMDSIGKPWLNTTEVVALMGIHADAIRKRARVGELVKVSRNRQNNGKGGGHAKAMYSTESVVKAIRTNPTPKWRKIMDDAVKR